MSQTLQIGSIIPAAPSTRKRVYANNHDLLHEIHLSKMSFCWTLDNDPKWHYPHATIQGALLSSKLDKNGKVIQAKYDNADITQFDINQLGMISLNQNIPIEDIVVRAITSQHMPADAPYLLEREANSKYRKKHSFTPFIHYALGPDGKMQEVLRSHWEGSLDNGHWNATHGQITDRLARIQQVMISRHAAKGNWINYSYVDEMQAEASLKLLEKALLFDEHRSENPFAYYYQIIKTTFINTWGREQIQSDIVNELRGTRTFNQQAADDMSGKYP